MYGIHLQLLHYLKIMPSTIPDSWSLIQATKTTGLLMPWLYRTHIAREGQYKIPHYCDKCMKTFPYGNSLYKIKAVVTNGLTIVHPCCLVFTCKETANTAFALLMLGQKTVPMSDYFSLSILSSDFIQIGWGDRLKASMMYYHIYLYHGNKYNYHCVIT